MAGDLEFVLNLAEYISLTERFPSSPHHLKVRRFLLETLRDLGEVGRQRFSEVLLKPVEGFANDDFLTYEGVPYTNSPSGEVEGIAVDCGYGTPEEISRLDLKGKIALVREGKRPFRTKELLLKRKGALGVIVFREELEVIYNGVSAGILPVLSLPNIAKELNGRPVKLYVKTKRVPVKGENLWIEFGTYRQNLTFVAHYDTKPNTKGAIDNALSVAVLLWLACRVSQSKLRLPYRVRFLFTDLEEFGLKGAQRFALSVKKELGSTVAVSVDTIGWSSPAILYKDAEGYNSRWLVSVSERILEYLNLRSYFIFTEGRSGRSDHIPFKRGGAKTLFLASNPFPFRHTELDTFDVIDRKSLSYWMEFLNYFVKNFHHFAKVY